MPKIFEYFGFVFFFYSNEHEPIHVHVIHGDRQLVYEIILEDGILKHLLGEMQKVIYLCHSMMQELWKSLSVFMPWTLSRSGLITSL